MTAFVSNNKDLVFFKKKKDQKETEIIHLHFT